MTTDVTNTGLDQTSDANMRLWIAQFIASMLAIGLTQTADTGQVNTATVTRAIAGSDCGSAVFRLNDAMQATAPVFIKFTFGSGLSNINVPRIKMQVGTASNGSGTLSGTGSANIDIITENATPTPVTAFPSYSCYVGNALWMSWKRNSAPAGASGANYGNGFFAVFRSVDSTGASTADGIFTMSSASSPTYLCRSISFLTSTVYATVTTLAAYYLLAGGLTSSLVSVSGTPTPQSFKGYMVTPRMRPAIHWSVVLDVEYPALNIFTETLIGVTAHTYIVGNSADSANVRSLALIWE